ncbi:lysw biosynthesis protein lysW [Caudoviricetes sp.]|nr:lysw biosynthesis protein lysW [Caudoviricetes sp.]UOF81003.1 lysw biosynthesis protein lysW [Caudoviricetes sp.]UOF81399.1 lysw biosynthesis protein lysW [Caudoviricetes sp.]
MICHCGFRFAGPGEFRNCRAFIDGDGQSGVICPKCGKAFVNGKEITLRREHDQPTD